MKVYPCGYLAHGNQIAALMAADPSLLLVDIRTSPKSRLTIWNQAWLHRIYGDRYQWVGRSLGNANYKNGGPIQLIDPMRDLASLLSLLHNGKNLLLLCGCINYHSCHRKQVVELLLGDLPGLEVIQPNGFPAPSYKAISIRQPWAWLICHPEILRACGLPPKKEENRAGNTHHRGEIYIHTGSTVDTDLFASRTGLLESWYWIRKFGRIAGTALFERMPQKKGEYPTGGVIGKAILSNVVTSSQSIWFNGPYGLVLSQAIALPTISYPGQLGLFDIPCAFLEALEQPQEETLAITQSRLF